MLVKVIKKKINRIPLIGSYYQLNMNVRDYYCIHPVGKNFIFGNH